ncbi:hypothetical protein [Desulfopila aestuarii]|uniref:hypothetical protein n=1 Tax=Desulfopila aestuarii TaxID=231440 RepID=UPI001161446B|nr:hypothetical protein [Desulfopila aestuarii]
MTFVANQKKLIQFIENNAQLLADFLNVSRLPAEGLTQYLDHDFLGSLSRFGAEHRSHQIIQEASDRVWSQHLKPKLIAAIHDDIIDQAITYTHEQHIHEVPFEEGRESRTRLMELVADVLTPEKIARHPIPFTIAPTYRLVQEDLQPYLNQLFTETVRDIFSVLHNLEAPLVDVLYKFYFNDIVPTKFSLDMLERYQQGTCEVSDIVSWALSRPDYWLQELLAIANRAIDRDPSISADEKLTRKAACYQLLKAIFLVEKADA